MLVNSKGQRVYLDKKATDGQRAECREVLIPEHEYVGKMYHIIERLSQASIEACLIIVNNNAGK